MTARWTRFSTPSASFIRTPPTLQLFQVSAVTEGTDAQAKVSVRLGRGRPHGHGRGADTDTLVAAAYAYVNALNKLLVKRKKTVPETLTIAR